MKNSLRSAAALLLAQSEMLRALGLQLTKRGLIGLERCSPTLTPRRLNACTHTPLSARRLLPVASCLPSHKKKKEAGLLECESVRPTGLER